MMVYRLARAKYANNLLTSGAPNRWNTLGQQVIYASGSISLCALELLAHTNGIRPDGTFKVMHIEIGQSAPIYGVNPKSLPTDWHLLAAYSATQKMGAEWYNSMKYLLMRIPSAIITSEWNYVINTQHPDFEKEVKLVRSEDFFWDHRFPVEG